MPAPTVATDDLAKLLLPSPRSLTHLGGDVAIHDALRAAIATLSDPARQFRAGEHIGPVRFHLDPDLGAPEAYRLAIDAEHIFITAATSIGLRHGAHTLVQVSRLYKDRLPKVVIDDQPSFPVRGVMLDISRDRVPTMAHLRETIDLLASLKINHLQLYTEHTFAYAGHDDAWRDASPITPDEARELDAYARARGIELTPNQNCFGHLSHWLKLPKYQHLAEIEEGGVWKFLHFERRGPFSLCPIEPRSIDFVRDLLTQLTPCFQSNLVNIGCDETFDVGWGRSKPVVEKRAKELGGDDAAFAAARAELFFDFVAKLGDICHSLGKRPMMWADIALTHPEMLGRLPKDMIGLAWWYEPTDKFGPWVEAMRSAGHEAWVCPGTSSWRSFTGRTTERRGNIADAAEQGARAGATGFLVCDWGDLGHRQMWPISLIGIAHAAHAAWNAGAARDFDARAASSHVFNDDWLEVGPWLEQVGDIDLPLRQKHTITNATAMFNDLHPPVPDMLKPGERWVKAERVEWEQAFERCLELSDQRPVASSSLLGQELDHVLHVSKFALLHALIQGAPGDQTELDMFVNRCDSIVSAHQWLWLQRSRPGGLPHATSYYQTVINALDNQTP